MQDLTSGSLSRHLLKTSSFMLVAMVFQTLYVLIDLYWVGRLGTDAVAAVAVSGNLMFVVLAATQMLGVGTTTLVSHAVGRKDHDTARLVFNQSLGLSATLGLLFFAIAAALTTPYANTLSADAETASLARDYLRWFIPSLALQFPLVAMGAAMRHGQLQAGDDRPERNDRHQHRPRAGAGLRLAHRGRTRRRARPDI